MDISDWAAVATILGVGITILTVLPKRIDSTRGELKHEINATRSELGSVRTELKNEINATRTELKGEIDRTRSDLGEVRTDLRFLTQRTIDFLAHPPEPHTPAGKAR